jgi:hypothetical protein
VSGLLNAKRTQNAPPNWGGNPRLHTRTDAAPKAPQGWLPQPVRLSTSRPRREWASPTQGGHGHDVDRPEGHDENGWHHQAPRLDPAGRHAPLALLEDLSNLLDAHGYPPLRGIALQQMTRTLLHLQHNPERPTAAADGTAPAPQATRPYRDTGV